MQRDMPNFFVEAVTSPTAGSTPRCAKWSCRRKSACSMSKCCRRSTEYKPGQKATVKVKLTDFVGKPFVGSTVLSACTTRASSTSPAARTCRRSRSSSGNGGGTTIPHTESSLDHWFGNLLRRSEIGMYNLGVFGDQVVEEMAQAGMGRAPGGERAWPRLAEWRSAWLGDAMERRWTSPMAERERRPALRQGRRAMPAIAQADAGNGARQPRHRRPASSRPSARTSPTPPSGSPSLTTNKDGMAEVNVHHAREPHRLEDQVWAHGPRHQGRPGRGRGRHQEGPDRPPAGPALLRRRRTKSSCPPTSTTTSRATSRSRVIAGTGRRHAGRRSASLTQTVTHPRRRREARRLARQGRQARATPSSA